jgi:hypothetical protein
VGLNLIRVGLAVIGGLVFIIRFCRPVLAAPGLYEHHVLNIAGVMVGFEDGSMRWEDTLTRAQALKVIVSAVGDYDEVEKVNGTSFIDVGPDHWACGYIAIGVELGLINGFPDNTFRPDAPVTSAEFAVMVARMHKALGDQGRLEVESVVLSPTWAGNEILSCNNLVDYYGIEEGSTIELDSPMSRGAVADLMVDIMGKLGLIYDLKGTLMGYDESQRIVTVKVGTEIRLRLLDDVVWIKGDQEVLPESLLQEEVGFILDEMGNVKLVSGPR